MADFRKLFPVLAIVALMLGSAVSASAQPALSCTSNAGVPPILRAEGLTELVGDLVLNCTGGDETKVFQANFQIFLNTNITSRLLTSATLDATYGGRVESLLMIDEPCPSGAAGCMPGAKPLILATANQTNAIVGGLPYANAYLGRRVTDNAVVWLGVPFQPPGSTGTRIIRITNVRANASQLLPPGSTTTLIPPQVVMYISISGSQSIPVNNPQQVVGFVQSAVLFDIRTCANDDASNLALLQCVNANRTSYGDVTVKGTTAGTANKARFREAFATAFKKQIDSAQIPSTPGSVYNTESGFVAPTELGSEVGYATNGTRLAVRFTNVPDFVKLRASIAKTAGSSTMTAAMTGTDANGAGTFSAVSSTGLSDVCALGEPVAPITITGGAGMAVWEIFSSDPFSAENILFTLEVDFASNTTANQPGLGQASASGNLAPFYTLPTGTTMSSTLPVPRFVDNPISRNAFKISACVTNLLFPFVTNQAGFDTGIAISNTSMDIFATALQAGVVDINYFGITTGGGATPKTKETSQTVAAGAHLVFTLGSGGTLGVTGNPGFQGYIIAKCFFQYAHGFAFVSDIGADDVAMGYLALVMDSALPSRTGSTSESLGQ